MRYQLLSHIVFFSGLLPLLFYKFSGTRHSREVVFAAPFIWLIGFASLYEPLGTGLLEIDSRIWFTIYSLLEFLALYVFFRSSFEGRYRGLLKGFLYIFLAVYVYLIVWGISQKQYPATAYLILIEVLLVFSAGFIWFRDLFTDIRLDSLWKSPTFYFLSGFILYFSGTFIFFLMDDFIFTVSETLKYAIVNVLLSFLLHITLILGIWKGRESYSGSQLQ